MHTVHVGRMLRQMTAKEFLGWEQYFQLAPFGDLRADYRSASIVAMIANVNRDSKRRPEPYTVEDFRLRFGSDRDTKPAIPQWQLVKSAMMHIMAQQNAMVEVEEERAAREAALNK